MKIKKAVVIATDSSRLFIPAEMMPLIDRPIIQYVIDEISQAGIEEVLIVLGDNSESLIKYFEINGNFDHDTSSMALKSAMVYFTKYQYIHDYAGAILSAKRFVGDEPFALLNGTQLYVNQTEPAIKQAVDAYQYLNHSILVMQETANPVEAVEAVLADEDYYDIKQVSLRSPDDNCKDQLTSEGQLSLCGRSVLRPEIFSYLEHYHDKTEGRSTFIEAMNKMLKDQKFYGIRIDGGKYDLSTKSGYIKSVIDLALDRYDLKEEIEKHIGEKMSMNAGIST